MKLPITFSLSALLIVLLLSTGLQAQQNLLCQVEVPFAFIAGGTHLPAGQYVVFHTTPNLLQIVRKDGRALAYIPIKAASVMSSDTRTTLAFNRYGNTYFLAKISTGHDQQVHDCFKCRAEEKLMAEFAKENVTIVAQTPPNR